MALHSIIVAIFGPYNVFTNEEMEFSIWVNVTFMTLSACIARSESDRMKRSGCVLLCCGENGA